MPCALTTLELKLHGCLGHGAGTITVASAAEGAPYEAADWEFPSAGCCATGIQRTGSCWAGWPLRLSAVAPWVPTPWSTPVFARHLPRRLRSQLASVVAGLFEARFPCRAWVLRSIPAPSFRGSWRPRRKSTGSRHVNSDTAPFGIGLRTLFLLYSPPPISRCIIGPHLGMVGISMAPAGLRDAWRGTRCFQPHRGGVGGAGPCAL